MVINNKGPGTIGAIVVNGVKKWENITFTKSCKVVVGEYVEIDGKELYRAGKKDKFYLTSINSLPNSYTEDQGVFINF